MEQIMQEGRSGGTEIILKLSEEETAAIDEAEEIIKRRAEAEDGKYNPEALEWTLLGLLREGCTPGQIISFAKEMPFYRKRVGRRGYA